MQIRFLARLTNSDAGIHYSLDQSPLRQGDRLTKITSHTLDSGKRLNRIEIDVVAVDPADHVAAWGEQVRVEWWMMPATLAGVRRCAAVESDEMSAVRLQQRAEYFDEPLDRISATL